MMVLIHLVVVGLMMGGGWSRSLCEGLDCRYVDPGKVAQKVVLGMYNGVSE